MLWMTFPPFRQAYRFLTLSFALFHTVQGESESDMLPSLWRKFEKQTENYANLCTFLDKMYTKNMHRILLQRRKNVENVTEIKQFCAPFKIKFTIKDKHHDSHIFLLELEKLYKFNSKINDFSTIQNTPGSEYHFLTERYKLRSVPVFSHGACRWNLSRIYRYSPQLGRKFENIN